MLFKVCSAINYVSKTKQTQVYFQLKSTAASPVGRPRSIYITTVALKRSDGAEGCNNFYYIQIPIVTIFVTFCIIMCCNIFCYL